MCVPWATVVKNTEVDRMSTAVKDRKQQTLENKVRKVILELDVQCRTNRRNGTGNTVS